MSRIILIFTIFLAVSVPAAQSKWVSFPSQHTTAVSPDGRFAIINLDSDKEPYHTLFLEDRKDRGRRKLLEYSRSVRVLWNPNSRWFAVTNYAGSNVSECYLYSTDAVRPKIDIEKEIIARMSPSEKARVQNNYHVYWEAVSWVNAITLRVKVWGHGDENPSGFTRSYYYRAR